MEIKFEKYGFYKIDKSYLEFLHSRDREVFYKNVNEYDKKPHLGIIARLGDMEYCIPLTSAKPKHLKWKNVSKHNLVIYELLDFSKVRKNSIGKRIGKTTTYKRLLAVLEIGKMIPIKEDLYTYIDFEDIEDISYRDLLEREYRFLTPRKEEILEKAIKLYEKQRKTGIIEPFYCNFEMLEKACHEYDNVPRKR